MGLLIIFVWKNCIIRAGGTIFKKIKQKRKLFANRRRRKGGGRSQY